MAFANRFHFRFDSIHGVEYNIYILQDGYSGECENRKLGRAPVLRKQKNGPVCGTSLDLYAECAPGHDGEFAALFTSNPKEYRVDVKRKVSGTDVLIWQGFVSTELYSEPSIYPPYDVQIVATDGLGELKLVDFIPVGIATLSQHFRTALAYTGMNRTIYVASSLIMTGESATDTFEMSISLDYMEGDSYYDVVTKLLDTLHATITMYGDKWLIVRETDLPALLSGSGLSVVSIAADGTASTTTIGGVHKTVGSMADNSVDTWPVGQLSTAIDPARKEVTVEAPWHTVSGPDDPNMEETTGSPWGTEGIVRHDTTDDCFYELGLDPNNPLSDDTWGTIKQEIPINKLDCGFQLKLRVAPRVYKLRVGDAQWYAHGNIKVHLEYDCYISSGSHSTQHTSTYIGTEEGWSGAPQHESDPKVEIPTTDLDSIGERWLSINIPAISTPDSASRYIVSDYATIRIVIEGHWVEVYECILTPSLDLPGYRDIIHLDNDAVGAAETVEITGGRVRSDNLVNSKFYGGIWIFNGAIVTSFADSVHSNGDFLSITALSYALSVAGRRLKTEGKLNIPPGFSILPLFITFDEILSWIETWEWDLIQEEAQVSAISLPAVEVQVESETVEGLPEGGSGGSGGTGNGTSSSSAYSYRTGGSSFFEEDGNGNIKLKDEYGGLWANGFMSSCGLSDDPGEEGVSLAAVWESLTGNTDDYANEKINAYHIPIGNGLSIDPATGLIEATVGASALEYLTDVQLTYPSAGQVLVYDAASSLWKNGTLNISQVSGLDNSLSIISGAIQSLQSQIDSVASRNHYDELIATALYAESAAILSLCADKADTISLHAGIITLGSGSPVLSWDSVNNAWHLSGNFYADGFISAFGVSSGGGSGSIDAAAMWSYLTNTAGETTYDSVLINTAHIPDMSQIYHYVKSSDITDMATKTWVNQQSFATTARLDSDEAIISSALQSLQAQIDSVASRNCFDELSATSLVTDAIAASNGYFNTIEGALTGSLSGNATTASYLVSSSYGAGTGKNPIYFSGGRPVASSSTEGSAGLPVFLSGGYLTACTASSLFSSLSSSAATNLSVTVAGQNRTATLYATYDSASENISSCFGTVSTALQSLQSQIDSVATRNMFDELNASAIVADVVAASSLYGSLTGNATTASYLVGTSYGVGSASLPVYFSGGLPVACTASSLFASLSSSAGANLSVTVAGQTRTATLYATYDSDGENISSCFGTISTAIRSLQSQIDSVAASRAFDELTVTAGYFDMLTVGANLNVDGHIYARGASVAGATASASDIKFKDDLEPILPNKAIDILMELKPTGWTWNDKSALEGKHSAGLIAQDVQKILPFAVMQIDDYMYLEYSVLHAYEIAGIQNHEQRISQLETENRKLKEKIRILEER